MQSPVVPRKPVMQLKKRSDFRMSSDRSRRNPWYVSSPSSNSTTRSNRSSSSRRSTRRSSSGGKRAAVAAYIALVQRFATALKENEKLPGKLLKLFSKKGHEYFSSHRSGYQGNDDPDELDGEYKVLNRLQFADVKREMQGDDEDTPIDDVIWRNEAAFDDSFRHAIVIDVSTLLKPKLVDRPGLLTAANDYILTWPEVQKLPKTLGPNHILVHSDGGAVAIFFPIPTV